MADPRFATASLNRRARATASAAAVPSTMIRVCPGVHSRVETCTVSHDSRHSVRISGGTILPVHTGA